MSQARHSTKAGERRVTNRKTGRRLDFRHAESSMFARSACKCRPAHIEIGFKELSLHLYHTTLLHDLGLLSSTEFLDHPGHVMPFELHDGCMAYKQLHTVAPDLNADQVGNIVQSIMLHTLQWSSVKTIEEIEKAYPQGDFYHQALAAVDKEFMQKPNCLASHFPGSEASKGAISRSSLVNNTGGKNRGMQQPHVLHAYKGGTKGGQRAGEVSQYGCEVLPGEKLSSASLCRYSANTGLYCHAFLPATLMASGFSSHIERATIAALTLKQLSKASLFPNLKAVANACSYLLPSQTLKDTAQSFILAQQEIGRLKRFFHQQENTVQLENKMGLRQTLDAFSVKTSTFVVGNLPDLRAIEERKHHQLLSILALEGGSDTASILFEDSMFYRLPVRYPVSKAGQGASGDSRPWWDRKTSLAKAVMHHANLVARFLDHYFISSVALALGLKFTMKLMAKLLQSIFKCLSSKKSCLLVPNNFETPWERCNLRKVVLKLTFMDIADPELGVPITI
ncbi:hypothetical protein DFH08DRAFT_821694 [Mycena albidolilacea]|uniref:Uncharacterized protein n=1 Tax=Mycena albidolilacea TaxID=1033008 RepID=A0AAD7EDR9_9AGAR|nr:hypothetical protein DFH08DRAFT_821694 [Mycena albidolilacea]